MVGQEIWALANLGAENSSFFGTCYNSSTVAIETLSSHPITNSYYILIDRILGLVSTGQILVYLWLFVFLEKMRHYALLLGLFVPKIQTHYSYQATNIIYRQYRSYNNQRTVQFDLLLLKLEPYSFPLRI